MTKPTHAHCRDCGEPMPYVPLLAAYAAVCHACWVKNGYE